MRPQVSVAVFGSFLAGAFAFLPTPAVVPAFGNRVAQSKVREPSFSMYDMHGCIPGFHHQQYGCLKVQDLKNPPKWYCFSGHYDANVIFGHRK